MSPRPASSLGPRRPPSRSVTLLGVLVAVLLLVGVVQAINLLRHPMPDGLPATPELDVPAADPRTEIVCEPPIPGALVTSNQLIDCPRVYHAVTVRYRGEVVGGVLRRADGAWVQLNDDVYAGIPGPLPAHRDYAGGNAGLGTFIPLEVADEIEIVGGPRFRGDVLEVTGEFRRIDPERREVAVIIATDAEVAARGRPIRDPVLPERQGIALGLAAVALAVAIVERIVASRR